jgi:hypothetical protein
MGYANIDSEKGSAVMSQLEQQLKQYAGQCGVSGLSNTREWQPADVGLTTPQITIAAGEASYTLERDINVGCAVAIAGFSVGDTTLLYVDIWRGTGKIHTWSLSEVYNLRDKAGVQLPPVGPIFFGPGQRMKLIFYPTATSTAAQTSNVWFLGMVLVPDMQTAATRGT